MRRVGVILLGDSTALKILISPQSKFGTGEIKNWEGVLAI